MSGSLRVAQEEDLKHDHIDIKFEDESILVIATLDDLGASYGQTIQTVIFYLKI